jgi:cytoskeleton protein RodZ
MPDDATRDFGAYLKDARERAGIPLRTIATTTKISMQSLEALERNDVSRLPGGIFLRAFVRAYALEVGLDQEDAVRRLVGRFPDAAAVEELTVREPVQERNVLGDDAAASRLWRVVGWTLPLILIVVWFSFGGRVAWLRDRLRPPATKAMLQAEQVPPGPETPVLTAPAPDAATAGAPAPDAAVSSAGAADASVPPVQTGPTAQPPVATPPAAPASPAGPRPSETITAPATEGRFTMTLAPRGRCWVTVRSNGNIVFSGTMRSGDRQNLVLGGSVSLTVGDAAAMAVELDGKPARSLGGAGEVRTVRLTAETLKDFIESR